ncbi:MAG: acyl carrier protein [Proteobacteria bacterium]|nr:acyl carrier protein [Pseudomonadota bacterium]
MNDHKKRIIGVMSAVFEIDSSEITEDAGPGTIGNWDSLGHMKLVVALEEEFDYRFPDEMVEQLISFKLIELTLKEALEIEK